MSSLIKSPADIGIERYNTTDIRERMKPIELNKDDTLLAFAKDVSYLFQESSESSSKSSDQSELSGCIDINE